jgi:hypothetical protein
MGANELSRLERWGMGALAAQAQSWPSSDDPVCLLTVQERAALVRIERWATIRAGIAGALSAGVSVAVTLFVAPKEHEQPVYFWTVVGVVSALAAVVEIGYLYWDGLRSVRSMARASGVRLYADDSLQQGVALALARAALELPSPHTNVLRVDPFREATKWYVVCASLLYKGKIALTGFLLKALLRRAFGRLATRLALEAVAIPVTAVWNIVVCRWVMREARLRAMGPSLASELAAWIRGRTDSSAGLQLVAWALGTSVVKNRQVHPNWCVLVDELGLPNALGQEQGDFGDCGRFLAALKAAPDVNRRAALRALVAAAILDGKVSRLERQWLEVTFAVAGYAFLPDRVQAACAAFVAGKGFEPKGFTI